MSLFLDDDIGRRLIALGVLDAAGGMRRPVVSCAADKTILTGVDASGTIFSNRPATRAVTLTFPAPSIGIAGSAYGMLRMGASPFKAQIVDKVLSLVGPDVVCKVIYCDGYEWFIFDRPVVSASTLP